MGDGRLPARIGSCYGGFTAKQWKNWILIYSVVAMKGMLPNDHMGCWLLYVNACKLLCKPVLKKEDIIAADRFFIQFCRKFEILYGKEQCTPNMHLHLHLKQCFLDFGPPHAFWCFAFERYNGILGSYHTNKRAVECQFMKKFLINQSMHQLLLNGNSFLKEFFPMKSMTEYESHGSSRSISDCCSTATQSINIINLPINDICEIKFAKNALIKPYPPFFEEVFDQTEMEQLASVLNQLYPNDIIAYIPRHYQGFGRVGLGGSLIGSTLPGGNNSNSSVIMAFWAGSGNDLLAIDYTRMRIGVIQYFLLHSVHFQRDSGTEEVEHAFAYVFWKKLHPNSNFYGVTSTVSSSLFETPAACCFLPVQRIASLAAHAIITVDFGTIKEPVFVTSPVPISLFL